MKPSASLSTALALTIAACIGAAPTTSLAAHRSRHSPRRSDTSEPPKRDAAILQLDPATRIEQRCNARAMGEISREHHDLRPDELVAYAFADTHLEGDHITAPGAAVRSAGRWYHLSYQCRTSADGMDIETFSYTLGDEVPREQWTDHFLVP